MYIYIYIERERERDTQSSSTNYRQLLATTTGREDGSRERLHRRGGRAAQALLYYDIV